MRPMGNDPRVLLALLMFGVTGGSAFIFVKQLVGEATPLQVVTGRVIMAALPLVAMMLLVGSSPRLNSRFLASVAALAAVDTVIPYLLIAWAQVQINSSTAALLVSTMPLFSTLIAARTSESNALTPSVIAGLATGFAGVALVAGPSAYDAASATAMLAVVGAAFFYAAGAAYSRTLMRYADPLGLSAVKLVVAGTLLLPVTVALDGLNGYATLSAGGWLALIEVGLISTGIGRWVYQWVIAQAGSVRASLVTYIVPAVAVVLAWAVLGEPVSATALAGAVLVLSGVTFVIYAEQLRCWLDALGSCIIVGRATTAPMCLPLSNRGGRS